METRETMQQRRTACNKEDAAYQYTDGCREIRPCYEIERQIEDKNWKNAKVDIVVPVIIGHIEERFFAGCFLEFIACALVVGVIHLYEPLGRLLLQIEVSTRHRFCKLSILLGIVASCLEEGDGRSAIPRSSVIVRCRNADQVRPHQEEARDQHDLDHHRRDDACFRLSLVIDDEDAIDGRFWAEAVDEQQDP